MGTPIDGHHPRLPVTNRDANQPALGQVQGRIVSFEIPADIEPHEIQSVAEAILLLQREDISQSSKNWLVSLLFYKDAGDKEEFFRQIQTLLQQKTQLAKKVDELKAQVATLGQGALDCVTKQAFEEHKRIEETKLKDYLASARRFRVIRDVAVVGGGCLAAGAAIVPPAVPGVILLGYTILKPFEIACLMHRQGKIEMYIQKGLTLEEAIKEVADDETESTLLAGAYKTGGLDYASQTPSERWVYEDGYEVPLKPYEDFVSSRQKNPKLNQTLQEIFAKQIMIACQ